MRRQQTAAATPAPADAAGVRERGRLETRRRLLEAGTVLFAEHGVASTRITDIAAAAGVAVGTVYLHFADKHALLREILFQGTEGLHTTVRRVAETPYPTVAASVRAHAEGLVDFADSHPQLCRILFSTEVLTMPLGAEVLQTLVAFQEERLRTGMADGYFRTDFDPAVAAQALIGMLTHVLHWWVQEPRPATRETVVDTLTKLRLAGLHADHRGETALT